MGAPPLDPGYLGLFPHDLWVLVRFWLVFLISFSILFNFHRIPKKNISTFFFEDISWSPRNLKLKEIGKLFLHKFQNIVQCASSVTKKKEANFEERVGWFCMSFSRTGQIRGDKLPCRCHCTNIKRKTQLLERNF